MAAAHKVRADDHRLTRLTFDLSLAAVQAVTIGLAATSLSNLAVLTAIQG